MVKISRITWEPMYSVHVEVIDEQHRKLFDTVNRLIDVFESGSDDLMPVIHELVSYISVHFHQEHMVMMNAGYPDLLKHTEEHRKFTEKVGQFLKAYSEGDRELGLSMLLYLKEWIRDHTTLLDIQYGDYLFKNAEKLKLVQPDTLDRK
ncbi:MAG: bacteriohemerythrin [Smithellaceae bacterium]